MAEPDYSPLKAAAGAAGPGAIEAFKQVGNETRLAILLALWEAYDRQGMGDNAVSFSTLYEQVDYDDRGNFRYHLKQLEGQYVQRTQDAGYELQPIGLQLVQTIIGGAGVANTELEPTEIDRSCELCGNPTTVCYFDGRVFHSCTVCEGRWTTSKLPEGYLNSVPLHPAGVTHRTPGELIAAAEVAAYQRIRTMYQGLCYTCAGTVNAELDLCKEHAPDGVCGHCGRRDAIVATFRCGVCKAVHVALPSVLCVFHPAVIAFFYDHGMTPRWHAEELDGLEHLGGHEPEYEREVVSDDPPRVGVTVTIDGDELQLIFDDSVTVVEVSE